jgi:hypothetical protein
MRATFVLALGILGACATSTDSRPTMVRGDRESSRSVRASAARPRLEAEPDRAPLEGDRLGLDEAKFRAERAHREGHASSSLALAEFSHPACSALQEGERQRCPLSSVSWSRLRDVDGGVEIETRDPGVDPTRLRWLFLCHMAFERARGAGGSCPLGMAGLDLSVVKTEGRTVVRLTAGKGGLSELRRQVRRLVSPR